MLNGVMPVVLSERERGSHAGQVGDKEHWPCLVFSTTEGTMPPSVQPRLSMKHTEKLTLIGGLPGHGSNGSLRSSLSICHSWGSGVGRD